MAPTQRSQDDRPGRRREGMSSRPFVRLLRDTGLAFLGAALLGHFVTRGLTLPGGGACFRVRLVAAGSQALAAP